MNVELSKLSLEEVLNFKELKKLFKHFSMLTGIDVSLHDLDGKTILANRIHPEASICELIKGSKRKECQENMASAGRKTMELGEPYIFKCGCMVKCSCPIIFDEKLVGSLSCGPVLLWDIDDIVKNELRELPLQEEHIEKVLNNVKQLSPENMTSAAQMLSIIVNYMYKEESKYLSQRLKIAKQQKEISELIQEKKESVEDLKALESKAKYPIDLERELMAYIQTGDYNNARRILNDILSDIFLISSGNLDIIKAKLFELGAIFMRAGVDSGAPLLDLSTVIINYTKIFSKEITYEDLCLTTSEVMEKIMNIIYLNHNPKQTNQNIIQAINYIKNNFAKELSLENVANNVFVSSFYLSHLFRDELNMTFSDYVNKIRMEESIELMRTTKKSIQEIAEAVGFNDASYFTKTFKKYYGVTPKSYMKIYC